MKTNHTQQRLTELGLSPRETKLYLALLDTTEMTAADLQRISEVPRTKIYETLNQMVSHGLCVERSEGRFKYFKANPPEEVLAIYKHRWTSEYERRIQTAESAFKELNRHYMHGHGSSQPLDFVEVLRNREQIHLRFLQLATEVQREVLAFMRPPFASVDPALLAEQEAAMIQAFTRGVRARGIYQVDRQNREWLLPHIRKSRELGEDVRINESLPVKQFVFDRATVFIALPSNQTDHMENMLMLVIKDSGYAEAGAELFEQIWSRSSELNSE